tara:strand:- start:275 stop:838 length:564 start_codon:yes stop_codon:yes gene_type:complete
MKKFIILITLIFSSPIFSQGFSIDTGLGMSFAGGDIFDDTDVKTGVDLKLIQLNYKFNESFGATVSIASSAHTYTDDGSGGTAALGRFSIGPSYTLPLGGVSWEIKPQIVVSSSGVIEDNDFGDSDIDKASGFVIGNSLLFGTNEGFQFIANVDLVTGKVKEADGVKLDSNNSYSYFNIGVGVRYNF